MYDDLEPIADINLELIHEEKKETPKKRRKVKAEPKKEKEVEIKEEKQDSREGESRRVKKEKKEEEDLGADVKRAKRFCMNPQVFTGFWSCVAKICNN